MLIDLLLSVPTTDEVALTEPTARANELLLQAFRNTALVSGGAAMVPGPLGLLTLLPDMVVIWKVQT